MASQAQRIADLETKVEQIEQTITDVKAALRPPPSEPQEVPPDSVGPDFGGRLDAIHEGSEQLKTRVDELEKRLEETEHATDGTQREVEDLRTLVPDWIDHEPPGVLQRLGDELDNPGSFRAQSRLVDQLVATGVDRAALSVIETWVGDQLPELSAELQQRIRAAVDERLSLPLGGEPESGDE